MTKNIFTVASDNQFFENQAKLRPVSHQDQSLRFGSNMETLFSVANIWKNCLQRTHNWLTKTVYRIGCRKGTYSMVLLKKMEPNLNSRKGEILKTP